MYFTQKYAIILRKSKSAWMYIMKKYISVNLCYAKVFQREGMLRKTISARKYVTQKWICKKVCYAGI